MCKIECARIMLFISFIWVSSVMSIKPNNSYYRNPLTFYLNFLATKWCGSEDSGELPCPLHWREGVRLQGLHVPPCDPQLHVPGGRLHQTQRHRGQVHLRQQVWGRKLHTEAHRTWYWSLFLNCLGSKLLPCATFIWTLSYNKIMIKCDVFFYLRPDNQLNITWTFETIFGEANIWCCHLIIYVV